MLGALLEAHNAEPASGFQLKANARLEIRAGWFRPHTRVFNSARARRSSISCEAPGPKVTGAWLGTRNARVGGDLMVVSILRGAAQKAGGDQRMGRNTIAVPQDPSLEDFHLDPPGRHEFDSSPWRDGSGPTSRRAIPIPAHPLRHTAHRSGQRAKAREMHRIWCVRPVRGSMIQWPVACRFSAGGGPKKRDGILGPIRSPSTPKRPAVHSEDARWADPQCRLPKIWSPRGRSWHAMLGEFLVSSALMASFERPAGPSPLIQAVMQE